MYNTNVKTESCLDHTRWFSSKEFYAKVHVKILVDETAVEYTVFCCCLSARKHCCLDSYLHSYVKNACLISKTTSGIISYVLEWKWESVINNSSESGKWEKEKHEESQRRDWLEEGNNKEEKITVNIKYVWNSVDSNNMREREIKQAYKSSN